MTDEMVARAYVASLGMGWPVETPDWSQETREHWQEWKAGWLANTPKDGLGDAPSPLCVLCGAWIGQSWQCAPCPGVTVGSRFAHHPFPEEVAVAFLSGAMLASRSLTAGTPGTAREVLLRGWRRHFAGNPDLPLPVDSLALRTMLSRVHHAWGFWKTSVQHGLTEARLTWVYGCRL